MSEFNSTNLVNIEELVKQAEKFEKTEVATLEDGFDLGFYPHFSYQKIQNITSRLGEFLNYNEGRDKRSMEFVNFVAEDETDENFMLLVYFFTVLEFTHIGEGLEEKKKPRELFPYFSALLKEGYLLEIIDGVFLVEEMAKVIRELGKISAINESVTLLGEEFAEQLEQQEDAIKRLQKVQKTFDNHREVTEDER